MSKVTESLFLPVNYTAQAENNKTFEEDILLKEICPGELIDYHAPFSCLCNQSEKQNP